MNSTQARGHRVSESAWVWSQLYLPRPLLADEVQALLLRLAADRGAPTLIFEARSDGGSTGVRHLLSVEAEHAVWVHRTLHDLLPGIQIEGQPADGARRRVHQVRRLRIRPVGLALATERAELVSRAILSALDARLEDTDCLVLQIVLGARRAPKHLPVTIPDPSQPAWQLLTVGPVPATAAQRNHIDLRHGEHGFAATVRIGVSAATPTRRQRLAMGVLGALSAAEERGTYVDLRSESARRLNNAIPPRWCWPLQKMAVSEVVGLLAWPLGDRELPGVAPLHPKLLPVAAMVSMSERVFAESGGPGASRSVGVSARDSLGHFLVTGPTGSGKSSVFLSLIRADIAARRAVLVIDPKQQLIDDIIERAVPADRIDDVVIINPADSVPAGFNPLDVGDRDPDVVVDGLIAVFAAVFQSGWGPRTEDVLTSALLTLASDFHAAVR